MNICNFFPPKRILCNLTPLFNTVFVVKSVSTCVVCTNVAGLITTYNIPSKSNTFFIQCCDVHSCVFWIWHELFSCPLQNSTAELTCNFCTCRSKHYVPLCVCYIQWQ
jgi:hypothetical protein